MNEVTINDHYQCNASYVEYMIRVPEEVFTFFFHTKPCFVELQDKPKISDSIEL